MLPAVRVHARGPVLLEHREMRAEPSGVTAAGRKSPAAGAPNAALDRDAAAGARQFRTPGEDAARRAEALARARRVEIGGRHRAAGILPEAPGRRGFGL